MNITFWGVRGSLACSGPDTLRYGGNTACISVKLASEHQVILDAGTGLRPLSEALMQEAHTAEKQGLPFSRCCSIFITHGHWDHIMGLLFFQPLYDPSWSVSIYAPENVGAIGLEALMQSLFNPALFPVQWSTLSRKAQLISLHDGQSVDIHGCRVTAVAANHGPGSTAFRLDEGPHSLFYSGDHELGDTPCIEQPFFQAMRGVDVAIVDAMYTIREYAERKGWGHSALEQWPPLAQQLDVKQLLLTHFNPSHTDTTLDALYEHLHDTTPAYSHAIALAHEGQHIPCGKPCPLPPPDLPPCFSCDVSAELSALTDMSLIFDALLTEARKVTQADAGTLYLLQEERLVFSYSQNETLYTASEWARQQYLNSSLPVDATSIAGFVALNEVTLNIHNVRKLPTDVPYSFNESFDNTTGYRTVSMCTFPLRSLENNLVGVIQLINSKVDGLVVPFTGHMQRQGERLCLVGAQAIERGLRVRDMILRMLQTAALRDPTETGGHVMRVGAMVGELYQGWGEKNGMSMAEIRQNKAQLRLASMLHDVGKVGIPDIILKKPGRLEPDERAEMEKHASMGAKLFGAPRYDMDTLARDIALHHHQKWDGSGYTGDPDVGPLAGEDIPLGARLTAIADVFDALVSPRCYKEPWPVEKAVAVLQKDAGTHFDPELVAVFVDILDTMVAIRDKYQD